MNKLKVYWAGGLHSGWQEVLEALPDLHNFFIFINPMRNGSKNPPEFISWDFLGLDQCDVLFLYLEKDNPGGHASMVEAGYVLGQGKTVVFVNEQDDNKYTRFLGYSPKVTYYTDLQSGVDHLKRLGKLLWDWEYT